MWGVVQAKVGASEDVIQYKSLQAFFDDVCLVFNNCVTYTRAHPDFKVMVFVGIFQGFGGVLLPRPRGLTLGFVLPRVSIGRGRHLEFWPPTS